MRGMDLTRRVHGVGATSEQRALFARLMVEHGDNPRAVVIEADRALGIMVAAMQVPDLIEGALISQRRCCRVCGCGELTACLTPDVGGGDMPCGWSTRHRNLCTACEPYLETEG